MRRLLSVLTLLAALFGALAPARADDIGSAREYFKKGQTQYALGEFDQAAAAFKEAYRLREVPSILFNIAQAMRLSGHLKEATFYYSQYLSRKPDAANRGEVETLIAELRLKMKHEGAGESTAAAPPDEAPALAPSTPVQTAEAAPAPPPAAASAPTSAPTASRSAVPAAALAPAPREPSSMKGTTIAGFGAAGAGVLLGAGAFVFHSSAQSSADELNGKYAAGTLKPSDAHLKSDIASKGKLATLAAVGSAALLVAGAVLVFAF